MIQFLSRLFHVAVLGVDPDRDPVNGDEAWIAFQAQAAAKIEAARLRHKAVKPIEAAQRSLVHSALARSITTVHVINVSSRSAAGA